MQTTYDTHALTPMGICEMVEDLGYEAAEWETTYTPPLKSILLSVKYSYASKGLIARMREIFHSMTTF